MLPHERNNPLKYDLVKLSSSIIYSSGMLFLLRPTVFKNNDISYFNSIIYIYDLLSEKDKIAADYRIKYPESSLQELAEIISIETNSTLTKSGLHHRFNRIKSLANKIKNNE